MEGHKMLLNFIEEIENSMKADKYSQEQLKKLAEASPSILENCGKATMPFMEEGGEKGAALENARIDVAKKTVEKFKSEGIENIDYKALKSIIEFSLDTLKTTIKMRVFYGEEQDVKMLTDEEKREFIDRDKYFTDAINTFFDVVANIDKEKVGRIEKIKEFFGKLLG